MSGARIGVVVVHGIGSQEPGFAVPFLDLLASRLERAGVAPELFAFQPVHWAEVLTPDERELFARMSAGGPLDWTRLRTFVVETLADAVAYRRGYPKEWDAYHEIHWEVYRGLAALRDRLGSTAAPLVAVAHSLGSVIFSDHVWDEQKGQGFGRDPFTRCDTLAGIITFGSNIPLFTLGLPEIRCITFPPPGDCLSPRVRAEARWLNYYDRDDVLGYPLRTLSASYASTVEADVEMDSGSLFTSWNPLSHNGYWTEPSFVAAVADQLANLFRAASVV